MFYISLFCTVSIIISFFYLIIITTSKYILKDKVENFSLKLTMTASFLVLFSLLTYGLIVVDNRIENATLKDGVLDYSGTLGDLIGGVLNPILALFGILAGGLAFYAQYKANKLIQDQFKIQQFESQFYEMLRLHKENVNEMKISGYEVLIGHSKEKDTNGSVLTITENYSNVIRITEGRKVFVTMNTELIACYEILELYNSTWNTNIDTKHLLDLAYKFFFFGSKSEIVASEHIAPSIINNFRYELNRFRLIHKNSVGVKNTFTGLGGKDIKLHIKYYPFSGHENRLGHYYRHLYSIVKYVVNKEKEGLTSYKQSRNYLKILRAQMSNDEQLMLYYNYIIGFGADWENEGYLTKYRMLHNLPIDKVKYADDPRHHFKDFIKNIKKGEGELFEWGDCDE